MGQGGPRGSLGPGPRLPHARSGQGRTFPALVGSDPAQVRGTWHIQSLPGKSFVEWYDMMAWSPTADVNISM